MWRYRRTQWIPSNSKGGGTPPAPDQKGDMGEMGKPEDRDVKPREESAQGGRTAVSNAEEVKQDQVWKILDLVTSWSLGTLARAATDGGAPCVMGLNGLRKGEVSDKSRDSGGLAIKV